MNKVEPIRSIEKIEEMKKLLGTDRNVMLFTLGINSGLRISDIIKLTVDDVCGGMWIDATILLTSHIDDQILNQDFFMFHRDHHVLHQLINIKVIIK